MITCGYGKGNRNRSGNKKFRSCGLDDEKVILDISISTRDIVKDPELLSKIITETKASLIAGPSGFGIPVTKIKDIRRGIYSLCRLSRKRIRKACWGYAHP